MKKKHNSQTRQMQVEVEVEAKVESKAGVEVEEEQIFPKCILCFDDVPQEHSFVVFHEQLSLGVQQHGICKNCWRYYQKQHHQIKECPICRTPISLSLNIKSQLFVQSHNHLVQIRSREQMILNPSRQELVFEVRSTAIQLGIVDHLRSFVLSASNGKTQSLVLDPFHTMITLEDGRKMTLLECHMFLKPFKQRIKLFKSALDFQLQSIIFLLETWVRVHSSPSFSPPPPSNVFSSEMMPAFWNQSYANHWRYCIQFLFPDHEDDWFWGKEKTEHCLDLHFLQVDDDEKSFQWGQQMYKENKEWKNDVDEWKYFLKQKLGKSARVSALMFVNNSLHLSIGNWFVLLWILRHPKHFRVKLRHHQKELCLCYVVFAK